MVRQKSRQKYSYGAAGLLVFTGMLAAAMGAEKYLSRPFTEWSQGDVKKILNTSPWSKLGDLTFEQRSRRSGANEGNIAAGGRSDTGIGGDNPLNSVGYVLIWYTRIPRLATIRLTQLQQGLSAADAEKAAAAPPEQAWRFILQSRALVRIDPLMLREAQSKTQLVRDDGARLAVAEVMPAQGVLNLVFPLEGADGRPFLTEQIKKFTFESSVNGAPVRARFNVADCLVDGKLER